MNQIPMKAARRTPSTSRESGRMRRAGVIPAIYYGRGQENVAITVNAREIAAIVRKRMENHIIDLQIEGQEDKDNKAIIKEIQKDVVRGDVLHVDFHHVSMDVKITVDVPVELVGEPEILKSGGAVLQHILRHLQVECLPMEIPEKISVDINNLEIGKSIHVSDLSVAGVTILTNPDDAVASITTVKEEPEEPVEDEAVEGEGEEGAEPELVKEKGKKAEEGEEAPADGKEAKEAKDS